MAHRDPEPLHGPVGRGLWDRTCRVRPGGGVYPTRSANMVDPGVLPGLCVLAIGLGPLVRGDRSHDR